MERRVVVTGMGALTPIGKDAKSFWKNLKLGKCGIDEIKRFDTTNFSVKLAAELKGYSDEEYFERKEAKRLDGFSKYAMIASREAWKDSGLDKDIEDMEKVGIVYGSGIGGVETIERENENLIKKGPRKSITNVYTYGNS